MGFWDSTPTQTTPSGITIKDLPSDRPEFKREYNVRISNQVSMKIEIKNSYSSGTYTTGQLTQSNGRWVFFEPERPADKILDRELLPTIQKLCNEILAMDSVYRKSNPNEFVDKAGVKWRQVT